MKSLFAKKERIASSVTENVHIIVDDEDDDANRYMTPATKGMWVSTLFTFVYFIRPIHMAIPGLVIWYGSSLSVRLVGYMIASVFLVSFLLPPKAAPALVSFLLSPILEYFQYDEVMENDPVNIQESISDGKQYIFACQPHGIVPFCGIAWSIRQAQQNTNKRKSIPTAVASLVLWTPILKHVMGIFGCISTIDMKRSLMEKEISSVRLYVGSTTDSFYCNEHVEVLQLTRRKRFIKVALLMGVDIIPVYMFGNTCIFSMWNHSWLMKISQWVQFPVTYAWGRYGLPIPKKQRLLYASGQPLGMPHLKRARQLDIDRWHKKYCEQVERLFEEYKGRVPAYKNKKLVII